MEITLTITPSPTLTESDIRSFIERADQQGISPEEKLRQLVLSESTSGQVKEVER